MKNNKNDHDALGLYFNNIKNIPLISHEEEIYLANAAKNGDLKARNKLIQSHLRFVITVAKKYQNNGLSLEDLISEGNIGLINAIEHFDVSRGLHFISYAVWWIRQSIMKALNEQSRAIRLPVNRSNQLRQIEKKSKSLQEKNGTVPEFEQVVNELEFSLSDMCEIRNVAQEMISLNQEYSDSSKQTLEDLMIDHTSSPEEQSLEHCMSLDIDKAFGHLCTREVDILHKRFGLKNQKAMSLWQIAKLYGLTKERVRQIEKQALQYLNQSPKTRHLADYCIS